MIQLPVDDAIGRADVGEIHDPATTLIDIALRRYLDGEGMSMEPGALMLRWDVGEAVRRLEPKFFRYLHNTTDLFMPITPTDLGPATLELSCTLRFLPLLLLLFVLLMAAGTFQIVSTGYYCVLRLCYLLLIVAGA
tara:strand:+ start:941 stop:1348 length:408 start_codon:yes stop_codon:yes gene_type:complete